MKRFKRKCSLTDCHYIIYRLNSQPNCKTCAIKKLPKWSEKIAIKQLELSWWCAQWILKWLVFNVYNASRIIYSDICIFTLKKVVYIDQNSFFFIWFWQRSMFFFLDISKKKCFFTRKSKKNLKNRFLQKKMHFRSNMMK